ncbi:mechanosensitive ion channel family protein [Flavobacteriaceae bacterium F08102]|nr:mechanosensitive ion channel family protein [Flavobacteriaceae bacterium F08102]
MDFFGYKYPLDSGLSIIAYCLFVILIFWLISRLARFLLVTYIKRNNKDDLYRITRLKFIKNSIKFFAGVGIFFVLVFTVPAFRSKATLIFSGAGILAAIIGFAAQAAVSNLIAGLFIVIFKPFRVGDYIRLDTTRVGIVEDITLRHTVINNFENKRLIIPNSIISTESILNHTIQDSYILSFNNFHVSHLADIDQVKKIIKEEALKLNYVIDNRTPEAVLANAEYVEVRVIEIEDYRILLRAYIWINEPFNEFKLQCALREAVHKRFLAENIPLPVPRHIILKDQ